eukprot:scaffold65258_cov36-Phaeocystis_antarctica.AAC.2
MFVMFLSDISFRKVRSREKIKCDLLQWSYDLRPSRLCDGPSAEQFARMNSTFLSTTAAN